MLSRWPHHRSLESLHLLLLFALLPLRLQGDAPPEEPSAGIAVAARASDEATEATVEWCESGGGRLVSVALHSSYVFQDSFQSADPASIEEQERASEGSLRLCLPAECVSLRGKACRRVRRDVLRRLLAREEDGLVSDEPGDHGEGEEGVDGGPALTGKGNLPWFIQGRHAIVQPEDRAMYFALYAAVGAAHSKNLFELHQKSNAGGGGIHVEGRTTRQLRIAVLGTHGPLSALAGEHLLEAAGTPSLFVGAARVEVDLVFYGQCYLCEEVPLCRATHTPSGADRACSWFHDAPDRRPEVLISEVDAAARSIAEQEPRLAAIVCIGLLLCHYAIERLPATVVPLQFFCMNPLQGSPAAVAPLLLEALARRRTEGRPMFATNAITSALLGYHLGRPVGMRDEAVVPPALTLFSRELHMLAARTTWSSNAEDVLLARNFLLLHDPVCVAFEAALRQVWPHRVLNFATHWNFGDEMQVRSFLQHRAVVFIPEHPYKNVFNDFYTLGLPTLVPNINFLAVLWPQIRHVETETTYDGWFDRRVPRVRLAHQVEWAPEPPEPFDLDIAGEAKVRHWLRLADFYHFPGVLAFGGLVELGRHLVDSSALEAARVAALQHVAAKRRLAVATFQNFVGHVLAEQVGVERRPSDVEEHTEDAQAVPPLAPGTQWNRRSMKPMRQKQLRDEERWPSFTACLNAAWQISAASSGVAEELKTAPRELTSWTVRWPALVPNSCKCRPRRLRLQVWRPIRVGWQQGARAATYQLVGENHANLRKPHSRQISSLAFRLRIRVAPGRRIRVWPSDVLAWALDMPPPGARVWSHRRECRCLPSPARVQDVATGRSFGLSTSTGVESGTSAVGSEPGDPLLCVGWQLGLGGCRWWPLRRTCRFDALGKHAEMPAFVLGLHAELSRPEVDEFESKLSAPPSRPLWRPFQLPQTSIAWEMSWTAGIFVVWFLEYASIVFKERSLNPISWTFFVCPPPEEAGQAGSDSLWQWGKVVRVFGASVGVSFRCATDEEEPYKAGRLQGVAALAAAGQRFLSAMDPYGPWLILLGDNEHGSESHKAADLLAEMNPSGLGMVLRARTIGVDITKAGELSLTNSCSMQLAGRTGEVWPAAEFPSEGLAACFFDIRDGTLLNTNGMRQLWMKPEADKQPWTVIVFSCVVCADIGLEPEPNIALERLLKQSGEALNLETLFQSVGEVLRLARLRPSLDVGSHLDRSTTYEELMTLRQRLESPDLGIFEDKIRLRRELLQPLGVAHTPTYYMSNDDPNILEHIAGRQNYVVKPTHMTESEHVAVVKDGRYALDVRVDGKVVKEKGEPVDIELLQQRVLSAWNKSAYEWECKAVVEARPGVIVEQVVMATSDPGAPEKQRVEEGRCHVVWGRAMAVEYAVGRRGSIVIAMQVDRAGRISFGADQLWAEHLQEESMYDPDGWSDVVQSKCLPKIMAQAERVASGARVDHLRVDFLVEGRCDRVYVSEVELFPAVPFPPKTMEIIEERWRRGYGF